MASESLTTLADRVEAGTVEMEGSLLGTAFGVLFPRVLASHPDYARRLKDRIAFSTKLDAGAYVDAAMMLCPDGAWLIVKNVMGPQPITRDLFVADVLPEGGKNRPLACSGRPCATPALALAAAALRAHASEAT